MLCVCAYNTFLEPRHQNLRGLHIHLSLKSPLKKLFIMIALIISLERFRLNNG